MPNNTVFSLQHLFFILYIQLEKSSGEVKSLLIVLWGCEHMKLPYAVRPLAYGGQHYLLWLVLFSERLRLKSFIAPTARHGGSVG